MLRFNGSITEMWKKNRSRTFVSIINKWDKVVRCIPADRLQNICSDNIMFLLDHDFDLEKKIKKKGGWGGRGEVAVPSF